jgi:hypothetical protein
MTLREWWSLLWEPIVRLPEPPSIPNQLPTMARRVRDAPIGRLDFEPVAAPLAGPVGRVRSFRDDALDAVLRACVRRFGDG